MRVLITYGIFIVALILDHPALGKICFSEVNKHQRTANEPTRGVRHGDRKNGIGNEILHNEKIELAESNEGQEHDDHGSLGIARSAKRARIDLVDTAKHIEG